MNISIPGCVLITAMLLGGPCVSVAAEVPATAPTLQQILEQQQQIARLVEQGAPGYGDLDAYRRKQLRDAQDQVFRIFRGHDSLDELSTDDQLLVYNALKRVDAVLHKRDVEDRMVCERAAIAGTRRYQMVCMTEAERRRKRESTRDYLEHRPGCTTQECVGG